MASKTESFTVNDAIKPRKAGKTAKPVAVPFVDEAPAPVAEALPTMTAAVPDLTSETAIPAPVSIDVEAINEPAPAALADALTEETAMLNETTNQTQDTMADATAEVGAKASEMFKDVQGRAQAAFEKSGETMKNVVEFQKANMEAVVESGKIAAQGAQTAAKSAVEFGRKNWEATSSFVKTVATVKSPTEFFKLQGEFMRGQFDAAVAEFSRSTEFNLKLAGEVAQPIQNRFAATGEMLKARMAA